MSIWDSNLEHLTENMEFPNLLWLPPKKHKTFAIDIVVCIYTLLMYSPPLLACHNAHTSCESFDSFHASGKKKPNKTLLKI